MTAELSAAFTFTDVQGLAALRREASGDTPEARRAVAQQFEAMFIGMMLSRMREAGGVDGGLIEGGQLRFHESLHDQQLALELARGPGIGLADAIMRQFGGGSAERPQSTERAPFWVAPRRAGPGPFPAKPPAAGSESGGDRFAIHSREEFVAELWPHASRAAAALGVSPDVLVAQAALETGWGRHMIRDADGRASFNLFGIKTGGGWSGPRVTVPTLEFVGGVPERRSEPFRVYGSVAESFDDYVNLVSRLPRYEGARHAEGARAYARALEAGGYSTDPEYADKIMRILEGGLPGRGAKGIGGEADRSNAAAAVTAERARGGET